MNTLSHRVDAVVMDYEVGMSLIKQQFPNKHHEFHYDAKPITSNSMHLLLHRSTYHKEIMDEFNVGMKKLRHNGKFSEYLLDMQRPDYLFDYLISSS